MTLTSAFWFAAVVASQLALGWPLIRWLRQRPGAAVATAQAVAGFVCAGAGIWGLFHLRGMDLEHHVAWLWALGGPAAALVGMVIAVKHKRVPGLELAVGTIVVLELGAAIIYGSGDTDLAGARWRAVLVSPAAIGLSSYFGASVGYLLWGSSGKTDTQLGYEAMVGRRFLLSKASPVLSTVTTISVVGVALGVWLVSVSLGVLAGFERDLQRKIIGANSHIVAQYMGGREFELPADTVDQVRNREDISGASPFVQGEVAAASTVNYTGALLFGIHPETGPEVLSVLQQLDSGSLRPLLADAEERANYEAQLRENPDIYPPAPSPPIIIGREMSKALSVRVGDRIRVLSPTLETITPLGPAPKSTSFRVAGIFTSKMYEFDARFAYTTLRAARRFMELGPDEVHGLQVRVPDAERSELSIGGVRDTLATALEGTLSASDWDVRDWQQRNQTLFAALKLERVVAFVVLVFIILVASFSIVNTLTMSVIEKQKEIAILKTMGARAVGIMKMFLVQGMLVGFFGTLLGGVMAVVTVGLLERFGFWIPGEVYYIDSLPVHLEPWDLVLVVLAALLIVWDFAVFPALRGSQLNPVEGLRDG